jgi:ABC-2 type transport system permease protein
MVAVLAVPMLILALYPLILTAFGTINFSVSYACLLAFFLLGAALISVCMFLSSLAENQIVAAIIGFASVLALYMAKSLASMIPETAVVSLLCLLAVEVLVALAAYFLTKSLPFSCGIGTGLAGATVIVFFMQRDEFAGLFPSILSQVALFDRFKSFTYGLLSLPTLIVYLSVCVFFVTLTILGAEKKRWN